MYDKDALNISKHILLPKEQMQDCNKHKKSLVIGIPKENHKEEKRVALSPIATKILIEAGHKIIFERDAGIGANYTNLEYSEAGATITDDSKIVFESEIILKISPFNSADIALMKDKQTIISALHIDSQKKAYINQLINKRVTALAFEYIKDEVNDFPIIRQLSELSGKLSINIASHYLSNQNGTGKGVLLGGITGIPPSEVVIIGAGTAAKSAADAAIGLGAVVNIFDNSLHKLNEIQQKIGKFIQTSLIQYHALEKALSSAEVVVGALGIDELYDDYIVNKEMVQKMKQGSIIIDLNVDNGSCFETTKPMPIYNPSYQEFEVLHYCPYNITSHVSRTASIAISNVLTNYLLQMGKFGGITNLLKQDVGLRNGAYLFNGILTNSVLGDKISMNAKDINLLMAAF